MTDTYRHSLSVFRQSIQVKFILSWRSLPIAIIGSLMIWSLFPAKLYAAETDDNWNSSSQLIPSVTSVINWENLQEIPKIQPFISSQIDDNWKSSSQSTEPMITLASLDAMGTVINSNIESFVGGFSYRLEPKPILIAAPENFNPVLELPPPPPPKSPTQESLPTSTKPQQPALLLESIQTDWRDERTNFQQHNQIIEPKFQFIMPNGEKITFKTGFNTFEQPSVATVTNIPLQFGWQGKTGQYTIQASGGIDVFNRLPIALNFNAQIDRPIFMNLTTDYKLKSALFLSLIIENGPYKTNAKTLESQITSWHSGLNAYWQIDPNTSLFSSYRLGLYNDGNFEQQSFSRLEHKFGQFWIAGNLFAWKYTSDQQEISGYFSPLGFLVYSAEVGWEGNIFSFLRCRVNANLGRQQLNGKITGGNTYQTRCTTQITPNIDFDFGYAFSNVRNLDTGDSPYNNQNFTGQLRMKF